MPQYPPITMMDKELLIITLSNDLSRGEAVKYHLLLGDKGRLPMRISLRSD